MDKLKAALTVALTLAAIGTFILLAAGATAQEPPVPPVCVQECEWVGDTWVCWTICY